MGNDQHKFLTILAMHFHPHWILLVRDFRTLHFQSIRLNSGKVPVSWKNAQYASGSWFHRLTHILKRTPTDRSNLVPNSARPIPDCRATHIGYYLAVIEIDSRLDIDDKCQRAPTGLRRAACSDGDGGRAVNVGGGPPWESGESRRNYFPLSIWWQHAAGGGEGGGKADK